MTLQSMLIRDEARRNVAYVDPLGKLTIGIGHHDAAVCRGLVWSDDKIDEVFAADVAEKTAQVLYELPWVADLDEPRKAVVIAMAFQMGAQRLFAFVNMLAAIERGDYFAAAADMRDSVWAHQTPIRAARMALQMQEGRWI